MSAQRRPATKRDTSGSNSRRGAGGRQSGSANQAATKARSQNAPKVDAVESGGAAVAAAPAARVSSSSTKAPKPAPARTKDADSKPSALAERGGRIRKLFEDTRAEVKKVTWPDKETTRNLTIVVIGISVVLGAVLGGMDYVLFQIFEALP